MKFISITDVCEFQGGTQPPKSEWNKESTSDRIRMLQIRDFTQSEKDHIEYVRKSKKLKTCGADDILIGRYGASIGKILTGLSGAYNVAIVKTIPDPAHLTKRFLYHLLRSPIFQNFIQNVTARAAQAGFNKSDLEKFKIPDLSLDDQIKIATLLSRVEALIATRKENLRQLEEFLKSTFLEMFGDPVRNEKGLEVKPLGKIASISRGRFSVRPRNDPRYFDGVYPYIQTGDINRSEGKLSQYSQTLNEKGINVSKEFKKGTVVIAIVGATIGETAILEIDMYAPDSVIGMSLTSSEVTPEYLEYLLRFWKPVIKAKAPEAARANINLETLKPLLITIPPRDDLRLFVKIEQKVMLLKNYYDDSLTELEALYGGLGQKAFKSELDLSNIPIEEMNSDNHAEEVNATVLRSVEIAV